jgi:hypothetical protein
MPQGSKRRVTSKQRRQAQHIEDSGRQRSRSAQRTGQMGYATGPQQVGSKKRGSGKTRTITGQARRPAARKRGGRKG